MSKIIDGLFPGKMLVITVRIGSFADCTHIKQATIFQHLQTYSNRSTCMMYTTASKSFQRERESVTDASNKTFGSTRQTATETNREMVSREGCQGKTEHNWKILHVYAIFSKRLRNFICSARKSVHGDRVSIQLPAHQYMEETT